MREASAEREKALSPVTRFSRSRFILFISRSKFILRAANKGVAVK